MHNSIPTTLPSVKEFKNEARELRSKDKTIKNHTTALNRLAKKYGYKNWDTIKPLLPEKEEEIFHIEAFGTSPFSVELLIEYKEKAIALRDKIDSLKKKYGIISKDFGKSNKETNEILREIIRFEETNLNHYNMQFLYSDIADFMLFIHAFEDALSYAYASLELNKRVNDKEGIRRSYALLSRLAMHENDDVRAVEYIFKKIEEGGASLEEEMGTIKAIQEMSAQREENHEPDYDISSHDERPPYYDVLFGEDDKARANELKIRGMMRNDLPREYAKRMLDQIETKRDESPKMVDEIIGSFMERNGYGDEGEMTSEVLAETIEQILYECSDDYIYKSKSEEIERLKTLLGSDPYAHPEYYGAEEDIEEDERRTYGMVLGESNAYPEYYEDEETAPKYVLDEMGSYHPDELQFVSGVYEEIQSLFNAIFPQTDPTQEFDDHVREVHRSVMR